MSRARLPVLAYHAVQPERSIISISPTVFGRQMRWLGEAGYRTLAFKELVKHLHDDQKIPDRTCVLTFDDGFECLYRHAFPVLKEHGFTATVFLVSGYCGADNNWPGQPAGVPIMPLLDWDQIGEMADYGIEFGSHTITHPRLDLASESDAEREILGSKADIEKNLAYPVMTFAFPYGRYNERVKALVRNAYSGACCSRVGFADESSDPFDVERIDVNYVSHPALFSFLENPMSEVYLGLRRRLREVGGRVLNRHWQ